jgi:hypothetical protein
MRKMRSCLAFIHQTRPLFSRVVRKKSGLYLCGFILLYASVFPPVSGQTREEESFLENREESDAAEWIDHFETLRKAPIDLNRASFEILQSLPLISPVLAARIVDERKCRGPFMSREDFIRRLSLNASYAKILEPYLVLSRGPEPSNLRVESRLRVQGSSPESAGYRNGSYPGSPLHATLRVRAARGRRFSAGLLVEKDPGEIRWDDHRVGFAEFLNTTESARVLLGNFLVETGQGLVFWSPYGTFKGADPMAPLQKRPVAAKGYLYAAEQKAFQGLLVRKQSPRMQWMLFASGSRLDAGVDKDGSIGSLSESGYHRTASENKKRGTTVETLVGGRIGRDGPEAGFGLSGFFSRYSRPVSHQNSERYPHAFTGKDNCVFGLDWKARRENVFWSGEAAVSRSAGTAFVSALSADWKRLECIVSYRSYDPDFQNPHASAFATGETQNERGWYAGFSGKPSAHSTLGAYVDFFRRPGRTYFIPVPSRGADLFLRFDGTFPRLFSFSVKARFRLGQKMAEGKTADGGPADVLADRLENLFRLEVRKTFFKRLDLKTYAGTVTVRYPGRRDPVLIPSRTENGVLWFQDVRLRGPGGIRIAARISGFKTDSYDSRMYAYENDLPGAYSIPFFYKAGARSYAMVQWSPRKGLEVSAKFGRVAHRGAVSWGSGADKITGNRDDEFGLQIDWTP